MSYKAAVPFPTFEPDHQVDNGELDDEADGDLDEIYDEVGDVVADEVDDEVIDPPDDKRNGLDHEPCAGSKRKRNGTGDLLAPEDVRHAPRLSMDVSTVNWDRLMPPRPPSSASRRSSIDDGELSLRVRFLGIKLYEIPLSNTEVF